MKRALIVTGVLAAAALLSAWAYPQLFSNPRNYVSFYPPEKPIAVAPGKKTGAELLFRVTRGFHINSNQPHDPLLIPTKLELNAPEHIGINVQYPAGEDKTFGFSPDKMNVYDGDLTLKVELAPGAKIQPGKQKITGILRYQACNDRACFPPNKLPVEFEIEIKK